MPYRNMFYFGDGETDIPCMKLVKDKGGCSVCVYSLAKDGAKAIAEKILADGRVNFIVPANYSEDSELDKKIKAELDEIARQVD